jgi:hypothetical protein
VAFTLVDAGTVREAPGDAVNGLQSEGAADPEDATRLRAVTGDLMENVTPDSWDDAEASS